MYKSKFIKKKIMVFKNIALILSGGEGKRFDKNIPETIF